MRNAGIPVYGVSGLFEDIDDVRAHGRDERVGIGEFFDGLEFMCRLTKALSKASHGLLSIYRLIILECPLTMPEGHGNMAP